MSRFFSKKKINEKLNDFQSRKNNDSSDTDIGKHNNAEVLSSSPPFKSTLLSRPVDFSVAEYQFAPTMHNYPICLPRKSPILSEFEDLCFPKEFIVPLPKNQAEVYLRSELILKCSRIQKKILDALFQCKGRITETNSWILYSDRDGLSWAVNLEGDQTIPFSIHLPLGGWINISTGEYGFDILSLCSAQLRCNYTEVYEILSKNMGVDVAPTDGVQKDELAWWIQEKTPISNVPLPYFQQHTYYQCEIIHESRYWHTSSILKGIVYYLRLPSGLEIQLYKTLWRHHKSQFLYWMELFPQAPYMLYNEHLISQNPEAEIWFVSSERDADCCQKQHRISSTVFSTCPGGLKNLPCADFSLLNKRRVVLSLKTSSEAVQVLPDAITQLKLSGTKEIRLAFNSGSDYVTLEEFMDDPERFGYSGIIEPRIQKNEWILNSDEWRNARKTEKKRQMLLEPVIMESQLIWMYAPTKIGKTWLALSIAYAVAEGECKIGHWKSHGPAKVLYIDGEMHHDDLDNRILMVMAGQKNLSGKIPFLIGSASRTDEGTIHLLDPVVQKKIENEVRDKKISLIVFDNYECLVGNSPKSFDQLIGWLKSLKKMGTAVLMLDHTNTDDQVQGAKKKIWHADLGIAIQKKAEANDDETISLFFEARSLTAEEKRPFVLKKESKDGFRFEFKGFIDGAEDIPDKPIESWEIAKYLYNYENMDVCQIATLLGKSESGCYKYLDRETGLESNRERFVAVKVEAERFIQNYGSIPAPKNKKRGRPPKGKKNHV